MPAGKQGVRPSSLRANKPPHSKNYGWESGRRLSVGRSSSLVLFGSVLVGCFLDCSVLVRSVGVSLASVSFRVDMVLGRRNVTDAKDQPRLRTMTRSEEQ